LYTFLEPTFLALVSGVFIDDTIRVPFTMVLQIFLDGSSEEALASFAGHASVVVACGSISADNTWLGPIA